MNLPPGVIGPFAMVETKSGQWLVFDTNTSQAFDSMEEAADAVTLRNASGLLATNDDRDQPPNRE